MEEKQYDRIKDINISSEMKTSFLDYAMSVIVQRALPDVKDGLKTSSSSYFICDE